MLSATFYLADIVYSFQVAQFLVVFNGGYFINAEYPVFVAIVKKHTVTVYPQPDQTIGVFRHCPDTYGETQLLTKHFHTVITHIRKVEIHKNDSFAVGAYPQIVILVFDYLAVQLAGSDQMFGDIYLNQPGILFVVLKHIQTG